MIANTEIKLRFNEIYDSTSKEALAYIMAKCSRTADIRDIFQESYMELYQVLRKRGTAYVTNERALVFRLAKQKIARHFCPGFNRFNPDLISIAAKLNTMKVLYCGQYETLSVSCSPETRERQ